MKKELLKSYINRLTKQDIVNYLSKECIPASDKEIELEKETNLNPDYFLGGW